MAEDSRWLRSRVVEFQARIDAEHARRKEERKPGTETIGERMQRIQAERKKNRQKEQLLPPKPAPEPAPDRLPPRTLPIAEEDPVPEVHRFKPGPRVRPLVQKKVKRITTSVAGLLDPGEDETFRGRKLPPAEQKRSIQVRMMVSTGTSHQAMADMMGMTLTQFRSAFRTELTRGHQYIYAAISQKLVGAAMSGDLRAIALWGRLFAGWQEVSRKEVTGKNGEPISVRNLDGPTLSALVDALGKEGVPKAVRRGTPKEIEGTAAETDMDALPWPSDEGDGE